MIGGTESGIWKLAWDAPVIGLSTGLSFDFFWPRISTFQIFNLSSHGPPRFILGGIDLRLETVA